MTWTEVTSDRHTHRQGDPGGTDDDALARQVVQDLAVEHGACIRPIQLRRTNLDTGQVEPVLVPCGHTLADVCPSCAERARSLGLSGVPFHEPFHADGRQWSMTVTERSDRNRRLRRRQRGASDD